MKSNSEKISEDKKSVKVMLIMGDAANERADEFIHGYDLHNRIESLCQARGYYEVALKIMPDVEELKQKYENVCKNYKKAMDENKAKEKEKYLTLYSLGGSRLHIQNPDAINLVGLPDDLSNIKHLDIRGRELNGTIPVPMNFSSFKGLPDKLPHLESINVYDSILPSFESLTA